MSKLKGQGALALWLDVEASLTQETDAWYVDEHLPERIDKAGYLRARRYDAIEGAPRYLSLFEATTPEALANDGYLALVRNISEQSRRIRQGFSSVTRNTFQVRISQGRGIGGVIGSFRLSAGRFPASPEQLTYLDALVPQIAKERCIVGVHVLESCPAVRKRMDAHRAVGVQDESTDYVFLIEATQETEIKAVSNAAFFRDGMAQVGWVDSGSGIYRLLYEVSEAN